MLRNLLLGFATVCHD